MKYTAIVPVKMLGEAKTRLSPYLRPEQRSYLMLEMLHHVLTVLQESQAFSRISVVSPDPHVLELAQGRGVHPQPEQEAGHNPALTAAAHQEILDGSETLLTISADLPLLQSWEIRTMLEQGQKHMLVLAPSQDGSGTNAILASPPLIIPYVFGIHSLAEYQKEAAKKKVSTILYRSMGLAHDIDTIEDLEILQDIDVRQYYSVSSKLYCFQ